MTDPEAAMRKPATMASGLTLVALLLAGFAAASPATAREGSRLTEQSVLRDRHGHRVGRIDREADGDLVLRDRFGFRTGEMQSDGRGGYVVRDRHGFRIGTVRPGR